MKGKYFIGVDEAGRGPLAGPVAVGVALVPADFDWTQLPGVGDSKQVSEKNREAIFLLAKALKKARKLDYCVTMSSAAMIDKKGIVPAVTKAMHRGLSMIERRGTLSKIISNPRKDLGKNESFDPGDDTPIDWGRVEVKLDGGLKAPKYCVYQETIIKGDSKVKIIGLASILAKVTRDAYMKRIAKRPTFALYGFAQHKGYGTAVHRTAVTKHGLSSEHRCTFCKNLKGVV